MKPKIITMSADQLERFERNLAELYKLAREQAVTLARIEERMAARKECPKPGMCIDLGERIDKLERIKERATGGWIAITAVGGALMAFVTLIATLWQAYK